MYLPPQTRKFVFSDQAEYLGYLFSGFVVVHRVVERKEVEGTWNVA